MFENVFPIGIHCGLPVNPNLDEPGSESLTFPARLRIRGVAQSKYRVNLKGCGIGQNVCKVDPLLANLSQFHPICHLGFPSGYHRRRSNENGRRRRGKTYPMMEKKYE